MMVFRYLIINIDELRFCFSFLFMALVSTAKIYQTLEACVYLQHSITRRISNSLPDFRIVMRHCFLCLI